MAGHVEYDVSKSLLWLVNGKSYWPDSPNVLRAVRKELQSLGTRAFVEAFAARYPDVMRRLSVLPETASSGREEEKSNGDEGTKDDPSPISVVTRTSRRSRRRDADPSSAAEVIRSRVLGERV